MSEPKRTALIIQCPRSPKPRLAPEFSPDVADPSPETPAHLRPSGALRLHLEPSSLESAKAHQREERQKVLDAMPDEQARERLRQSWADEDDTLLRRRIDNWADCISKHQYGCTAACLPVFTREKVLVIAKLAAERLGAEW